ncbi:DUF6090 family protein [Hanstruepera ponticola]|uniref:DUF6090 family protein n=1 Tax=Hanstruepera ponticola TaxID=2042995 RepID=UPI00177C3B75|nr:DUF6090 family protein [Hanstruepera ponticola]
MLKFFRRTRQHLLADNKTGKYIKYAIGEIILVVIGILIALQVNNWNTERQLEQTGRKLLKNIQKDLLTDIESATNILETYVIKDSLARLVVNNKFTISDYQNSIYGPEGTYFMYWYDNFVINKEAFLKFKDFVKNLDDSFISFQDSLDELYITQGNYIDKFNQRISTTVYKNLDYLAKSKTWYHEWQYGSDTGNHDESHLFFLEDPIYKNQVANYINDYKNLNRGAQTFRVQAVSLYKKISDVLNETPEDNELLKLQISQEHQLDHYLGNYKSDSESIDMTRIILTNNYLQRQDSDGQTTRMYRHSNTSFFMFKTNEVEVVKFNLYSDPNETSIKIMAKHKYLNYKKVNTND